MGDLRLDASNLVGLLEQLMTQKANANLQSGYDELRDVQSELSSVGTGGRQIHPDAAPQNVRIGAVNPWVLSEALLGRKIDHTLPRSVKILTHVLQTDYDELFDMKFNSVLYAGLKLDAAQRKAIRLTEQEMKLLKEQDLETPDLSCVERLDDLEKLGLKNLGQARVKAARLQNGKLVLSVDAGQLSKTLSNHQMTRSVNELASPFRVQKGVWQPPNTSWHDMYDDYFQRINARVVSNLSSFRIHEESSSSHAFDDPIQGCAGNSWLIAALFSVFWADPACINRATRMYTDSKEEKKRLAIKFFDKGGSDNNARTETVEVNYEIPMLNTNNEPLYCRSSDGASIWPSLYEKAFAKWVLGSSGAGSTQHPDITQLHSGDPIKAMAQINGREPFYYECAKHDSMDLLGLVRRNCVNFKTINPMAAWTYATGPMFRGSNLVANHAYSVLGYVAIGERQYLVLRNPWGVTEPTGLVAYPGLITNLDPVIWYAGSMMDRGGLLAMEPHAFKECFAYIGVAKEKN